MDEVEIAGVGVDQVLLFFEDLELVGIYGCGGYFCYVEGVERGYELDACELFLDGSAHGSACFAAVLGFAGKGEGRYDAVDAVAVLFKMIEAQVVIDEEEDHQGSADADGEAGDVDEGKDFVAPEITEGDDEVIL